MMHIAAVVGKPEAIRLLLAAKSRVDGTLSRIEEGLMSERRGDGVDPDRFRNRSPLNYREWRMVEGLTPLHEAAKYGHSDACSILLQAGASGRGKFRYRRRTAPGWSEPTQERLYEAKQLATYYRHKATYRVLERHDVAWVAFLCATLVRLGRASPIAPMATRDKVGLLERLPAPLAIRICKAAAGYPNPTPPGDTPATKQTGYYWSSSYLGLMGVAAAGNRLLGPSRGRGGEPKRRAFDAAT